MFFPFSIFDSVLGVSGGLINLPIIRGVQGLLFSFKDKKFNPRVFLGISKVFQGDVPLSGVFLLVFSVSVSLGVDVEPQLLALVNFGIPIGSWRSSSFGIIVYTEINSATSPAIGALSKPLVFLN